MSKWRNTRRRNSLQVRRSSRSRNFTYSSLEENQLTAPYAMAEQEVNIIKTRRSAPRNEIISDEERDTEDLEGRYEVKNEVNETDDDEGNEDESEEDDGDSILQQIGDISDNDGVVRRHSYSLRRKVHTTATSSMMCKKSPHQLRSLRHRAQTASPTLQEEAEDIKKRPIRKCVHNRPPNYRTNLSSNNPPRLPRNVALERSQNRSTMGLMFSNRQGRSRHSRRRHSSTSSSTTTTTTTSAESLGKHTSAHKDFKQEKKFERRQIRSMARGRHHLMPMNMTDKDINDVSNSIRDKTRNIGSSCADIDPMLIDREVGFESVGGLTTHVQSLKEIIQLPMMYPELYKRFDVDPPKGVLFYGPPGTGKTLIARALANECSRGDRKVAFFMRKGADCLSKWVGESERQLRLLFDQAYRMRPAIIFFDEIDGLAPVRSTRQDQIHSSIVSTLLALMDGLDKREQIVVIGATNRLDAIDPALRRPGRFDRELRFDLPDATARRSIIEINTKGWKDNKLSQEIVNWLAENTPGYCGADLKALCTEAVLIAVRKMYPHIYLSKEKLLLDPSKLNIDKSHFAEAMRLIVPAAKRDFTVNSQPVNIRSKCFVAPFISEIISTKIPDGYKKRQNVDNLWNTDLEKVVMALNTPPSVPSARLLIYGNGPLGQTTHFMPMIMNRLDHLPVFSLSCEKIFTGGSATTEENVAQTVRNALRATAQGSAVVLLIPDLHVLEFTLHPSTWKMLVSSLTSFTGYTSIFVLASTHNHYSNCSEDVKDLFRLQNSVEIQQPDATQRREYFLLLLTNVVLNETPVEFNPSDYPEPPKAICIEEPAVKNKRNYTAEEYKEHRKLYEQMLRQLRIFLRDLLGRLIRDRRFNMFSNPVDKEEVTDYYEIIKNPICLADMMFKIDSMAYKNIDEFLDDIKLICANAIEYNPLKTVEGRNIRHAAHALVDMTDALIDLEMDDDFPEKLEKERIIVEEAKLCVGSNETSNQDKNHTNQIHITADCNGNRASPPQSNGEKEKENDDKILTAPENSIVNCNDVQMENSFVRNTAKEVTKKSSRKKKLSRKRKASSSPTKNKSILSAKRPSVQNGDIHVKVEVDQGALETVPQTTGDDSTEPTESIEDEENSTTEESPRGTKTDVSINVEECPGIVQQNEFASTSSANNITLTNGEAVNHIQNSNKLNGFVTQEVPVKTYTIMGASIDDVKRLTEKAVTKSVGWSVPNIECLGAEIEQISQKHRQNWNRSELLKELEVFVVNYQL